MDIWDDRWLWGYGTWLPLVLALATSVLIWLVRRHRK